MFKKVFQVFTSGSSAKEKAPAAEPQKAAPSREGGVLNKITAAPTPAPAPAQPAKAAAAPAPTPQKTQSPEEICGITAKMSKDEIKAHLALLYRRYNRATSSLDAKLRAEADRVLDAVVVIREKTFGPI